MYVVGFPDGCNNRLQRCMCRRIKRNRYDKSTVSGKLGHEFRTCTSVTVKIRKPNHHLLISDELRERQSSRNSTHGARLSLYIPPQTTHPVSIHSNLLYCFIISLFDAPLKAVIDFLSFNISGIVDHSLGIRYLIET